MGLRSTLGAGIAVGVILLSEPSSAPAHEGRGASLQVSEPFRLLRLDGRDATDRVTGADRRAEDRSLPSLDGVAPVIRTDAPQPGGAALLWFWASIALLFYTYIGYPALIWTIVRVMPRPVRTSVFEPTVSLVVVAYNEERRIAARIENLKRLEYPAHRREIIVVSDGSTDRTAELARLAGPDVRVIDLPVRRGKASAYDQVLPQLSSDILVLADARQQWSSDAVRALVGHFADPSVGAVSGELVLASNLGAGAGAQGAEVYWNFEKRLRWWESQVDSTIGVTGAITALRTHLFEPIPVDTVLDDVTIPLRITRKGYRVTFEPKARAFDRLSVSSGDEFGRKVRTLAGNFQLFAREPWLLLPWCNRLWLQTISHKGLRLVMPLLFVVVLIANLKLIQHPFYQFTMLGQLLFYGMALLGGVCPALRKRVKIAVIPYAVCFLAWATLVGFVRFLRGRQPATWDRPAVPATP